MSALTAPQREPTEANPPAEEPRRESGADGAPLEASAFAQMDAGQRLAHLRSLLAAATNANPAGAEDWRRRNAPQAEPAPTRVELPPARAAPAKTKTAASTPRRVVETLLGLALVAAVGYRAAAAHGARTSSVEAIVERARRRLARADRRRSAARPGGAPKSGAALAPGELLFRVVDPRADRGRVDDLSRQLAQARDEQPRLAARLESARAPLAESDRTDPRVGAVRDRQLEKRAAVELRCLRCRGSRAHAGRNRYASSAPTG